MQRKTLLIILILLAITILTVAIFVMRKPAPVERELTEEEIIQKQLEELNATPSELTEEQAKEQLEELNTTPSELTEEQIQKQLEELNKR